MADFSGGASSKESVGSQTRANREDYIRNADGDLVGNNYKVPKGDFSRFLGYKAPTPEEMTGKTHMSGARAIEVALQKEMSDVGLGATRHGNEYRNIAISWGRFANEPGRERDMIKDGIDAIRQGPEKNSMEARGQHVSASQMYLDRTQSIQKESHNDNVKLLELQYKFMEISKNDGVISNLMKVRNDAVTRTIRGGQG
jgi:hypothetical protein